MGFNYKPDELVYRLEESYRNLCRSQSNDPGKQLPFLFRRRDWQSNYDFVLVDRTFLTIGGEPYNDIIRACYEREENLGNPNWKPIEHSKVMLDVSIHVNVETWMHYEITYGVHFYRPNDKRPSAWILLSQKFGDHIYDVAFKEFCDRLKILADRFSGLKATHWLYRELRKWSKENKFGDKSIFNIVAQKGMM